MEDAQGMDGVRGLSVAYQGEPGAYGEEGARALFPAADHVAVPSVRRIFEAVEVGRADYGLAPMDDSQAGSITETYDLFLKHGLHLVGETVVRVDHCLLALSGTSLEEIEEVVSHPQAVAHSEEFLSALGARVRAEYNTAGAAKRIAEARLEGTAAIASRDDFVQLLRPRARRRNALRRMEPHRRPERPETGSRLMPPWDTDYGLREFAVVDPSGNLLRIGSPAS